MLRGRDAMRRVKVDAVPGFSREGEGLPMVIVKGPRGPGDVVAWLVKPLAKLLGLENCKACMRRREGMNRWWRRWFGRS